MSKDIDKDKNSLEGELEPKYKVGQEVLYRTYGFPIDNWNKGIIKDIIPFLEDKPAYQVEDLDTKNRSPIVFHENIKLPKYAKTPLFKKLEGL